MSDNNIPDWVTNTPHPNYELVLWWDGSGVQEIDLTEVEYIALKRYLAQLRGHIPADVE